LVARQNKLFVRDRLALLLDDGSFAEEALLANWDQDGLGADGVVTGVGTVAGRTVCVMANDPTVRGGTTNPMTMRKSLRAYEIAPEDVGIARAQPGALSGGMRKRAGLARALALDPRILLVDEPSAGLDPITSEEIDALLVDTKKKGGATLVVVTHNMLSARRLGDQLLMLHEGRAIAHGTPEQLDEHPSDLVRAFMTSQHAG